MLQRQLRRRAGKRTKPPGGGFAAVREGCPFAGRGRDLTGAAQVSAGEEEGGARREGRPGPQGEAGRQLVAGLDRKSVV